MPEDEVCRASSESESLDGGTRRMVPGTGLFPGGFKTPMLHFEMGGAGTVRIIDSTVIMGSTFPCLGASPDSGVWSRASSCGRYGVRPKLLFSVETVVSLRLRRESPRRSQRFP